MAKLNASSGIKHVYNRLLPITEGEVKTSRVDSVFRRWSKRISATICRTASTSASSCS